MKIILTAVLLALATVTNGQAATLSEACDNLNREACAKIARQTAGQCASPGGLGGCRFDSLQSSH